MRNLLQSMAVALVIVAFIGVLGGVAFSMLLFAGGGIIQALITIGIVLFVLFTYITYTLTEEQ